MPSCAVACLLSLAAAGGAAAAPVGLRTPHSADGAAAAAAAHEVPAAAAVFGAAVAGDPWAAASAVLANATAAKVFPGAVAVVGNHAGTLYTAVVGNYTDDGRNPQFVPRGAPVANPAPTLDTTKFDMASCTKVVATTSAVALLYQRGFLGLDDLVQDHLGPAYAAQGKGAVTVRNCLLHDAGYPPDPSPNFWDPAFGCAGAPLPDELSFNCSARIFDGLLNQTLENPIGAKYVYSDLSMITLMYVVGKVVMEHGLVDDDDLLPRCGSPAFPIDAVGRQCFYEAFVRTHVLAEVGMDSSGFLPSPADAGECMPTGVPLAENTSAIVQGRVNDGNAYILGGIAGHAGLFSTGRDVEKVVRALLWAADDAVGFLNATTVDLFTTEYNHSQSSRALGWDTNDPVNGLGLCGDMGARTFTHTGYTGTQICADRDLGVYSILLTNRVYPNDTDFRIEDVRKAFHTAVVAAVNATNATATGGGARQPPGTALGGSRHTRAVA